MTANVRSADSSGRRAAAALRASRPAWSNGSVRVVIRGELVKSASDVHDQLASQLEFGPYYGRNLDALWDRLSTDVERPLHLIWTNSSMSELSLGPELFERFRSLLDGVVAQDESWKLAERFTLEFA